MKSAIRVYGQRYGIEAMFKDCKTAGYNLEGCQAAPDKLIANHDFIATAKAVRTKGAIHLRSHLVSNQTDGGVGESDS